MCSTWASDPSTCCKSKDCTCKGGINMRSNLQSYLGIDFGLSKIGVALSFGSLSEPYKTLRYKTKEELILKLKQIIEKEKVEKIIVGMSEGEMAKKTKEF